MPGTYPGVNTLSARRLYKRETALLSTKFFHEGNAAKLRRNAHSLGRRMSFRLLSPPLFISLPLFSSPSFFLFYSQSARRSLNWSAFRRQSKSNQTLTSITNAPWVPVKPRIPTISVFRKTADNSGFTALLKISTVPTRLAGPRSDTSGLNVTSCFFLSVLYMRVEFSASVCTHFTGLFRSLTRWLSLPIWLFNRSQTVIAY